MKEKDRERDRERNRERELEKQRWRSSERDRATVRDKERLSMFRKRRTFLYTNFKQINSSSSSLPDDCYCLSAQGIEKITLCLTTHWQR